jgi:hypothetical protein
MEDKQDVMMKLTMQAVGYQIVQEYNAEPIRTLGEVILLLKMQPQENIVQLDFDGRCDVFSLHSYRGYYQYLALGYNNKLDKQMPNNTVSQMLEMFESAQGRRFTGYKGGEFLMHSKTIVFVANYGDSTSIMLTDIKTVGDKTFICTKIHVE